MTIVDFSPGCVQEAEELAKTAYEEERKYVPDLPEMEQALDLLRFTENGLGAAAFEGGRMVGFLCCTDPFPDAFQATGVKGVFSPMGANAARRDGREKILAALYREAAGKWVRAGAVSHGICLYAHDMAAQRAFFQYGFGMRCVDAIRCIEKNFSEKGNMYTYSELAEEEFPLIYPMEIGMLEFFRESPFFMNRPQMDCGTFCRELTENGDRCFAAWVEGEPAAYLKISERGETFVTERTDYRHVSGAFCREAFRGKGVCGGLLRFAMERMKREGMCWAGVDYESLNPAASGFWPGYFQAYTAGLVRRVDERILNMNL